MKEFFTQHIEKVVLGVCGLLALWFLYSSLMAEGYERTVEDFATVTQSARTNVSRSQPNTTDLAPIDYDKEVAKLDETLDPSKYQLPTSFRRPMELGMKFREQPQILRPDNVAVQLNGGVIPVVVNAKSKGDLQAFQSLLEQMFPAEMIWYAGNEDLREAFGIVKVKEDTSGGGARGNRPADRDRTADVAKESRSARWVEIVAEFPHAEQIREFIQAVKEPAREVGVRYALAEIQRCELTESLEWSEWKTVAWSRQFDLYESATLDDPLKDSELAVVPGLVMRVPERANLPSEGRGADRTDRPFQMRESLEPESLRNPPVYDGWSANELDLKNEGRSGPPQPRRPSVGGPRPASAGRGAGGGFNNRSDLEFALMRVWDFTVESGKRYQYRVRAVLFNPNYMREDVVDPDYSIAQLLEGPWSKPTAEVYVEPDTSWFIAEKQSIRDNQLNLVVHSWSEKMANYLPVEMQQQTGQVVGRGGSRTARAAAYDAGTDKLVVVEEALDPEAVNTREILLDVTPGDVRADVTADGVTLSLPGDTRRGVEWNQTIRPPRDAIVMNEYGDLIRHSELEDVSDESRLSREREYRELLGLAQQGGDSRSPNRPTPDKKSDEGDLLDPF